MISRKKNNLVILLTFLIVIQVFAFALPALARPDLGIRYVAPLDLANADPREAAVDLVGLLMTFLGIIAVVIILYGGFVWLTAAGNEDNVGKAKKIITAGVIGLVIILSAFVIVSFVTNEVSDVLGN